MPIYQAHPTGVFAQLPINPPMVMPGFAVRITSAAVYAATIPFWVDPGIPVIIGMSPTEIAALTGARLTGNTPDGHPTIFDNWMDVPCVIATDQILGSTGAPAPFNVGGGTVPNPTSGFTVPWAWQCSVEFYGGGALPGNTPQLQLKVGSYTGNGTSQAINVGFDMTVNAGVMVKPQSGGSGGRCEWRGTGMTGSSPIQASLDADGITSLTVTGFTVGANDRANANAVKYGYLAVADQSGTQLKIGSYVGVGNTGIQINVANVGDFTVGCAQAQTAWVGAVAQFGATNYCIAAAVPGVSLTFAQAWVGVTGLVLGNILGDNRVIPLGDTFVATHVWVFGQSHIYRSTEFPANSSVRIGAIGTSPLSDGIKSFGLGSSCAGGGARGFIVGTNGDVNSDGAGYYYMAIASTAQIRANALQSGVVNPAAGSDTISGLPFAPSWASTIQAANNKLAMWRAAGVQTGTDSTQWGPAGEGVIDVPAQGIRSLTSDGFTCGTTSMPAAATVYWWAWKGTASLSPLPTGSLVGTCPIGLAYVGLPYTGQITVTGGTSPYTFALITGALPPGLVLNPVSGVISGIPTTVGTYSYGVRLLDSTLDTAIESSVSCLITVGPTIPPNTPIPAPPTSPPGFGCPAPVVSATTNSGIGCRTPAANAISNF